MPVYPNNGRKKFKEWLILKLLNSQERKLIRDTVTELLEKINVNKDISRQDLLDIIANTCKKER